MFNLQKLFIRSQNSFTHIRVGMTLRDSFVDDFSGAGIDGAEDEDFDDESNGGRGACGMFGSLLWSQADLLGSAVSSSYSSSSSRAGKRELTRSRESQRAEGVEDDNSGAGESSHSSNIKSNSKESKEHSLVQGLKPMRDKYLLGVLAKMSAPIAQMFPELEGYTGTCKATPFFHYFLFLPFLFLQRQCHPNATFKLSQTQCRLSSLPV